MFCLKIDIKANCGKVVSLEIKEDDDYIHEKERKNVIKNISDKLKDDASSIDDIFSDIGKL